MQITCPHCQYSKDVNQAWIPSGDSQVECPECHGFFYYSHSHGISISRPEAPVETIECPACGLSQPKGDHCSGCGIVYAKWQKRKQAAEGDDDGFGFEAPSKSRSFSVHQAAKGGFWIRVAAYFIDGILLNILIGIVLFVSFDMKDLETFATIEQMSNGAYSVESQEMMQQLAMSSQALLQKGLFFVSAVSLICLIYYIVPTALTGRTPGKKVCGLRVVSERGKVGFLRAILRETVGKMLSSILCLGYLMVAFHKEKRGLHDLIAGTWVIKG